MIYFEMETVDYKFRFLWTIFLLLFLVIQVQVKGLKYTQNEHLCHDSTGHSDKVRPETTKNSGEKFPNDEQFCLEDAESECCSPVSVEGSTGAAEETDQHDEVDTGMTKEGWDNQGYVTFLPHMGNFGNQMELYLGTLAFAKALNRTLIIPPFRHVSFRDRRVHISVSFTELFQVDPLLEFHRVIPMEEFLERLAPKYWPPGQRKGYSFQFPNMECRMDRDRYWHDLNPPVEFDECIFYKLMHNTDLADERSMKMTRDKWNERFPPKEHPVLVLSSAAATFPMLAGNRQIQKYIKWTDEFIAEARTYIEATFESESWVAIHLRNGGDWVKACVPGIETRSFIMASVQCHEKRLGAVTQDMCLPSVSHMLELTNEVFRDVRARHLFIATDNNPYLEDFQKILSPLGVLVHHLNPSTPQMDLTILGQADYFIGTCTSSFTSFVKRERDANGKPSIFWGQEYHGF